MEVKKSYMEEKEFNLIEESLIRVIDRECQIKEVSLMDVILHAHEYIDLSGELPTQDVAVLRVILAVLHTVFSRVDLEGNVSALEDEDEAYERWKALWDRGQFPEKPIKEYLEQWKERFWLFHPRWPFGQVAGLDYGTKYDAPKLNGEISESGNKVRLFSSYAGKEKESLSYAQAARWLLYINAFDDTSAKPSKEGKEKAEKEGFKMESPGAGWLGKVGLIVIKGNNLFETLMYNFILVQVHRDNEISDEEKPVWENEFFSVQERKKINVPNNLSALYTLQSRRLLLQRKENKVTGFVLLGGDFFDKDEVFIEPMTVWRRDKTKTVEKDVPKKHDKSKQMWREFASIYLGDECREPGVILWNKALTDKEYISGRMFLNTQIVSVQYGDKDFFVNHLFSDALSIQRSLIVNIGRRWQVYIRDQIQACDELAKEVGNLARKIYLASGGDVENTSTLIDHAKEQFYDRIDFPFRKWLQSIDAEDLDCDAQKKTEWSTEIKKIAYAFVDELVRESSEKAYTGKIVIVSIKGKETKKHYSVPKALNEFQIAINRIYPKRKGGDK